MQPLQLNVQKKKRGGAKAIARKGRNDQPSLSFNVRVSKRSNKRFHFQEEKVGDVAFAATKSNSEERDYSNHLR